MALPSAKFFRSTLERLNSPLQWTIARVPFDVKKTWKVGGKIPVRGTINGFSFRTSLFAEKNGRHYLLINKRMMKGANAALGSVARFELSPDTEERVAPVPPELKAFLAEDRSFLRWYQTLTYSMRKYMADWITEVQSKEARVRRAEQIAERLLATIEAEQELPPLITNAFRAEPQARAGWEKMSRSRRRGHLMGIFYYRDPASRARRLEKAIQDALLVAEKESRKKKP